MYLKEECGLRCRSHLLSTHSSHCAPTGRRCTGGHLFRVVPGRVLGIWLAWNSSEACNGSTYRRNSAWTFTFSRRLQRFMVLFFIELSAKSRAAGAAVSSLADTCVVFFFQAEDGIRDA